MNRQKDTPHTEKINIDANRLARLSRLSLEDGEARQTAAELTLMAEYTYSHLGTEEAPLPFSCAHTDSLSTMREDVALTPQKDSAASIIALAPACRDGLVWVPPVIREEK